VRSRADEYFVTATNAYNELSTQRLDVGRGYDKRSVEMFRALSTSSMNCCGT
jgi:hypothetical protein